jgi:pimeloyl-ACP methyl ester carboxylesterase
MSTTQVRSGGSRVGGRHAVRALASSVVVTGCVLGLAAAAASSSGSVSPKLTPCEAQGVKARCGTLTVPENRARPKGRKIGLNVVVVPAARKPAAADAFTYIPGGPGGAATQLTSWVMQTFPWVHTRHDIVLVDQRGTGQSNPLACALPTHPLDTPARARAYAQACLRSLKADVSQYGTRAAMDDLDALRAALGYRKLDIYGASYGATAAQVYLKRHPSSVRTITLDGATAIDVPFFSRFAVNAQAALDQVAARCAADAACRKTFPTWRQDFSKLVRAWDETPITNRKNETTTGSGLAGVVQGMLLDAATAAEIPLVVSRAAAGDYRPLNTHIKPEAQALNLMFYGIWCSEPWVGLDARGPWHTDFDSNTTAAITSHRGICAYVPKRAEPAAAWALPHATTPLLLLAGGADPQDPIGNMPQLKQAFPDGRALVVPDYGHTVAQYGCMGKLVSNFVISGNAHALNTSCVSGIRAPTFILR